jgi:hypothetical protein
LNLVLPRSYTSLFSCPIILRVDKPFLFPCDVAIQHQQRNALTDVVGIE